MMGTGFTAEWSAMISGTTNNLNGVWGSSGSDVFAVGNGGNILHYDGTTWSRMESPRIISMACGGIGEDVFAVGGQRYHPSL